MGYNKFLFNIIIRISLISLTIFSFFFLGFKEKWIFTSVLLLSLIISQIVLLIRYVNRTNRELANFLIHLKEQDVSQAFSESNLEKTFKGLTKAFESVRQEYAYIKEEKQRKQNILDLILEQIKTGLIAYNSNGKIEIFNPTACELLNTQPFSLAKNLKSYIPDFFNFIEKLSTGEQKIYKSLKKGLYKQLLVNKSQLNYKNEKLFIISFQNVNRELSEKELESWNGLIRIITHEIMNTLVPMSTVIGTIEDCLENDGQQKNINQINQEDIEDTLKSAKIIDNRIQGLAQFVRNFKKFTSIPEPEKKPVSVKKLIEKQAKLFSSGKYITIRTKTTDILHIEAEEEQIDLVLQNLLINSLDAVEELDSPSIDILSYAEKNQIIIEIKDNGKGIPEELKDKVLTPFFTTKKQGSGIGLSLSRQIMLKHNGDLIVDSSDKGTSVKLAFPCSIDN